MSLLGERDTAETRIELFADELIDILRHGGKIDEGLITFLMSNYTTMMTFVIRRADGSGLAVSTFQRFYDTLINVAIVARDILDGNPVDDDWKGAVLYNITEDAIKKLDLHEALCLLYNNLYVDKQHPDYIIEDCFDDKGNYREWFYPEKVSEEV